MIVTNADELTSNTSTFQVVVSDPPITIRPAVPGFLATAGYATGLEEVGQFADPGNPTGLVQSVAQYAATVDWGDGSAPASCRRRPTSLTWARTVTATASSAFWPGTRS